MLFGVELLIYKTKKIPDRWWGYKSMHKPPNHLFPWLYTGSFNNFNQQIKAGGE